MSASNVMTRTALVQPLAEFSRDDLDSAGSKGANLGELLRAGLPVPPGFVITTAAYDALAQIANIQGRLNETLSTLNADDLTSVAHVSQHLRDTLLAVSMPAPLEDAIRRAYRELGGGPVAVRSSATAEDLPQAAFAGQQDTFLNIVGESALLDAVRQCWVSLWSERAISYRVRQQIDQTSVKLAVVVQRMVPADSAGVMFTANPVTGAQDELVIDASLGLGEAIVSGLVTPDHLIVDKRSLRIKEQTLGHRETIIRAKAGGGTEHITAPHGDRATIPALAPAAVRTLAQLGVAIEQHYHAPQDIEWAFADSQPYILQARPITALPSLALQPSKPQEFMASLFAEMMPDRPYPIDMTTWAPALYQAIESIFALLGLAGLAFDRLFVEEDGVVVRLSGIFPYRPTPAMLVAPFKLLWMILHYNPVHWRADPILADAQTRLDALEKRELKTLAWQELLDTIHEALAIPLPAVGELRRRYFPRAAFSIGAVWLVLALLHRGKLLGALLSGVENQTLEANHELERLADQIRSDPVVNEIFMQHSSKELWAILEQQSAGRLLLAELKLFLDRFGHREAAALMVTLPTWKDAPEVVFGILKGLVAAPPRSPASTLAWQAARDEVLAHSLMRLPYVKSTFLKFLAQARCLIQIREDTHFLATTPMPIVRRTLIELGRRLIDLRVLQVPEDVFHLKLAELEQIHDDLSSSSQLANQLRDLVQRRKQRRTALESTPVIDPRFFKTIQLGENVLLSGASGSPGIAIGPVCIVNDDSEFGKLHAGDILVAPFTNPAWTPLFQRAAAVVVDSGSALSHAAIVAREYGIPAVMGTHEGTHKLVDKQRVRVDGNRGFVLRGES